MADLPGSNKAQLDAWERLQARNIQLPFPTLVQSCRGQRHPGRTASTWWRSWWRSSGYQSYIAIFERLGWFIDLPICQLS